jgi:signal transduction histidine kinase
VWPIVFFAAVAALSVLASATSWPDQGPAPLVALVYASVGTLIVRRTDNRIGWLLEVVSLSVVGQFLSEAYLYRSSVAAGPLPGVAWAGLVSQISLPIGAFLIILVVLLYPTGSLPSRRWAVALWALVASGALALAGLLLQHGTLNTNNSSGLSNPLGVLPHEVATAIIRVGTYGMVAGAAAAIASVIVRSRRVTGDEREQIRWLAYVSILGAVLLLAAALIVTIVPQNRLQGPVAGIAGLVTWGGFILCLVVGIPAAMAFAILKYHLYDIDVVIRRTVVYAALAVFITAVYVILVVGVGALVDSHGKPNLGLSIAATAIVAVAFQPVRERVQRFANRLVYGKRATPYEALSTLTDRMAATHATEDLLPRMARVLAEATGATRADVWLRDDGEVRSAATWPADADPPATATLMNGDLPEIVGADRVAPVRHRGELLGALSIAKRRGETVTPLEDKLIDDLSAQAGPVLRNVGLTGELVANLEELRASRHRLVTARDEERRRVERSIHGGAERQLREVTKVLGLVAPVIERDAETAHGLLRDAQSGTTAALEDLRELARGIYPPLLADKGLAVALEGQARKSAVPVDVRCDGVGRYSQEIESTVYFCMLQALQNITTYADASRARIELSASNGDLSFEIGDDGRGFDLAVTGFGPSLQAMSDRLEALNGSLAVRTALGIGTTVVGRLPARALDPAG